MNRHHVLDAVKETTFATVNLSHDTVTREGLQHCSTNAIHAKRVAELNCGPHMRRLAHSKPPARKITAHKPVAQAKPRTRYQSLSKETVICFGSMFCRNSLYRSKKVPKREKIGSDMHPLLCAPPPQSWQGTCLKNP